MASSTLTDKQLEEQYGRRFPTEAKGIVILDEPTELGYRCPRSHKWNDITWSEFKKHIWCYKCQLDYPSALCPMKRPCSFSRESFEVFVNKLPFRAIIVKGVEHYPDCKIPHEKEG